MVSSNSLFLTGEEAKSAAPVSLIRRAAILENVTGDFQGAKRFAFSVVETKNGLEIIHENGSTNFIIDRGRSLEIDEESQEAYFLSRRVLYVIREMNSEEADMYSQYQSNF